MAEALTRRTPVQRRAATTVEYLLEAAAHILERDGLTGYTTNAIAQRAGISIGSLYQYFPNKDAVTAALVLRDHADIAACLTDAIERSRGKPFAAALAGMIDIMIARQKRSPRLARILELEEERMPRSAPLDAIERDIARLNRLFFGRFADPVRCDETALAVAARDIACIIRGLLDAALIDDAIDAPDLPDRLQRAIGGYFTPLAATAASQRSASVAADRMPGIVRQSRVGKNGQQPERGDGEEAELEVAE